MKLEEALKEANLPVDDKEKLDAGKVTLACVMNTFGIMPEEIRSPIIKEMIKVAGDKGSTLSVFFNADKFKDGIETFYKKSPELCGNIMETDIDYTNTTLHVAESGYYSHWFSEKEIHKLMQDADVKKYDLITSRYAHYVMT